MAQLKCKQTIFDKQNVQFFLSRLTIISSNIFWYVSKLIVIEQWLREYNTQEYLKTPALGCVGRGNSFTWPLTTPPPPHPFANNSNLNNSYSNNIDCNCRSCKIYWCLFNSEWMRLSILWRIVEIEESVIRRGRRPRRITPSEISIILHMIRKPNSITALLFIQNNS